jgi:hypothetical protein
MVNRELRQQFQIVTMLRAKDVEILKGNLFFGVVICFFVHPIP